MRIVKACNCFIAIELAIKMSVQTHRLKLVFEVTLLYIVVQIQLNNFDVCVYWPTYRPQRFRFCSNIEVRISDLPYSEPVF